MFTVAYILIEIMSITQNPNNLLAYFCRHGLI